MSARTLEKFLHFTVDIIAFSLAFVIAAWSQHLSGWTPKRVQIQLDTSSFYTALGLSVVFWIFLFSIRGLYRKWILQSWNSQFQKITSTLIWGCFMIAFALMGTWFVGATINHEPLSIIHHPYFNTVIIYFITLSTLTLILRSLVRNLVRILLKKGVGSSASLVIGTNEFGKKILQQINENPQFGQKIIGFIQNDQDSLNTKKFAGLPVLGPLNQLKRIIHQKKIKSLILTQNANHYEEILPILKYVADLPIPIYLVPNVHESIGEYFKTSAVHGLALQELFPHHLPHWQAIEKRLLDIFVALTVLLISSPILILSMILIKLDSKGPIFYSQERLGQFAKKFKVYKLRSMTVDAEANGPQWAQKGDRRVTRVGKWLRKLRIDEIPQIWCVLKGDMSMVGPRPEREHFVIKLKKEIPLYGRRLLMKPGLTGWAQVSHHYDSSIEDVKKKLNFDLYYFDHISISLDIKILTKTIWVVLTGKGAQ